MASSKSRAVAGSMVTVRRSRRSSRRPSTFILVERLGLAPGVVEHVSSSKTSGIPSERMTAMVSTLGWPLGPKTSVMTPSPARGKGSGYRAISSATLSPGFAPFADVDRVGERRAVDLDVARGVLLEVIADEQARSPIDDLDDPVRDYSPAPSPS